MGDTIIRTTGLTKDYGHQRGIFDLNLEIKRGEVHGYIGTNGSGKTTTIRNMMGFILPDRGEIEIMGMDAWKDATELKKHVSYVPGEIFFPNVGSGSNFLKLQAEYLGIKDLTYMNELIRMLQLDPSANLKKMSKGMKQKTAIVAALMGDKDILILDEPTTGLDPLMREVFLDIIKAEKSRGKTIFMSSHIFEEIEDVCDRVSMIKDGRLVGTLDLAAYRRAPVRRFQVTFATSMELEQFGQHSAFAFEKTGPTTGIATFDAAKMKAFLEETGKYQVKSLREERKSLEDVFLHIYREGENL